MQTEDFEVEWPVGRVWWSRDLVRDILGDVLGGIGTGGGGSIGGDSWDECAAFRLPNGDEVEVMFYLDDDHAGFCVSQTTSRAPVVRYRCHGDPAEVLGLLVVKLMELGYRQRQRD